DQYRLSDLMSNVQTLTSFMFLMGWGPGGEDQVDASESFRLPSPLSSSTTRFARVQSQT
ncbi:hypothetical protein BgiMline_022888, partial [Biomphalaria glabrata]